MLQKRISLIIDEIAEKYGKPSYVIEEVFLSQFKLVKETINSLEFKTIKLPSLGKFIASDKKVEEFKDILLNAYNKYGASSYKGNALQGKK